MNDADPKARQEFVTSRTFNAPRELVWKAFTEPERMKQWWGPKGAEVLHCKMDLRPGGMFHYRMRFMNNEMWGRFIYREIEPPKRIVFVNSFSDEQGGITRHPMSPTWPREMLTTITFDEQAGKTTFTVRWVPINATDEEWKTFDAGRGSMQRGWSGTFDQLAGYLEKVKGRK
jgi:uncharacterized protein YndB with AHSA1/START domain